MNIEKKKREIFNQIEKTGIWNELMSVNPANELHKGLTSDSEFVKNFTTHQNYDKGYVKGKIVSRVDFTIKKKHLEMQQSAIKFMKSLKPKNTIINKGLNYGTI